MLLFYIEYGDKLVGTDRHLATEFLGDSFLKTLSPSSANTPMVVRRSSKSSSMAALVVSGCLKLFYTAALKVSNLASFRLIFLFRAVPTAKSSAVILVTDDFSAPLNPTNKMSVLVWDPP